MKADLKREEMLDAFMQAFIEYGLDKSSTKKLTAKAGVNEALLYYYFADKHEAIVACVNRQYEKNRYTSLELIQKYFSDPEKLMDKLYHHTKKTASEQRFMMEVISHPIYSKNTLPKVKEVGKKIEEEIQILANVNGKDPKRTLTLVQLGFSTFSEYCITKNEENLLNAKEYLIEELKK